MPKSKRNRPITLSQTRKKGREGRSQLIDNIRDAFNTYKSAYAFAVKNMRNSTLKEMRAKWKDSRFFFGKNKVMIVAIGRTDAEEQKPNAHKLVPFLTGQCGILFTNEGREKVEKFAREFKEADFARAGFVATETVTLQEGPIEKFAHSMEPHLRALGLPTALNKGVIMLRADHTVCKIGDVLTPEQAKILRLLGMKMAEFSVELRCVWQDGKFESFVGEPPSSSINGDVDIDDADDDGEDEDDDD